MLGPLFVLNSNVVRFRKNTLGREPMDNQRTLNSYSRSPHHCGKTSFPASDTTCACMWVVSRIATVG